MDKRIALASSSEKSALLIAQAKIYKEAGIEESFHRNIRRAIDVSEGDTSVLATVVLNLTESGDQNDCQYAIDLANDNLVWHSSSSMALGARAKARICVGNFLGAFDDLSNALALDPENRQINIDRQNIPNRISDTDKALELHEIIIDHDKKLLQSNKRAWLDITYRSTLSMAYIGRSNTHAKRGDKISRLADLKTAVETWPDQPLLNRAFVFLEYKMFDEAIDDVSKYIEATSKRYGSKHQKYLSSEYMRRGYFYRAAGRYDEAIADYKHALELAPDKRETIEPLISKVREH